MPAQTSLAYSLEQPPPTVATHLHNIRNNQNYSYQYINFFAFTVRHEEQHRLDFSSTANWGNAPAVPSLDTDGDGLKDANEGTFINGRIYYVQQDPSYEDLWGYGVGWDDLEDAALWQQEWPSSTEYDNLDWSNPGKQYGSGYTLP